MDAITQALFWRGAIMGISPQAAIRPTRPEPLAAGGAAASGAGAYVTMGVPVLAEPQQWGRAPAHPFRSPSSRGLGRGPFKAETRVRIPVGTPH